MDPRFQTSFIPKKPIVAPTRSRVPSINLLSFIATVIFVVTLAAGGGVYFYNNLLSQQIDANKATLDRAKSAFEPALINQIVRLDSRIQVSKSLLAAHITILPVFDYISSITLKTVRFRDFSLSYLGKDKVLLSMKGQAQGYASVALQSDLLYAQKLLKDTSISDMVLDPSGSVLFNVTASLDPSLLSYATELSHTSTGQTVDQQPTLIAPPPASTPAATTTTAVATTTATSTKTP